MGKIIEKPYDFNENHSKVALEDLGLLNIVHNISYGAHSSIGMALGKLAVLEGNKLKITVADGYEDDFIEFCKDNGIEIRQYSSKFIAFGDEKVEEIFLNIPYVMKVETTPAVTLDWSCEEPRALTLGELRGMDGEPVWLANLKDNDICCVLVVFIEHSNCCFQSKDCVHYWNYFDYGKTWIVYGRQPKGE